MSEHAREILLRWPASFETQVRVAPPIITL